MPIERKTKKKTKQNSIIAAICYTAKRKGGWFIFISTVAIFPLFVSCCYFANDYRIAKFIAIGLFAVSRYISNIWMPFSYLVAVIFVFRWYLKEMYVYRSYERL